MKKNNRGFTLIELVVTIAIIAIFSGVVLSVIHTSSRSFTTTSSSAKVQMKTQEILDTIQDLVIDANRSVFYSNGSSEDGISNDIDGYEDVPDGVDKTFYVCNADPENADHLMYDVLRWDSLEHSLYSYYAEGTEDSAEPGSGENPASFSTFAAEPDGGSGAGIGEAPVMSAANYETLLAENVISFRADTTKVLSQRIVRFRIAVEEKGKIITTIHTVKLRNEIGVEVPPSDLEPMPKPTATPSPEATISPTPTPTSTPTPSPTPTPAITLTISGLEVVPAYKDGFTLDPASKVTVNGMADEKPIENIKDSVIWHCSGNPYVSIDSAGNLRVSPDVWSLSQAPGTFRLWAEYTIDGRIVKSNELTVAIARLRIREPQDESTLNGKGNPCEVEYYWGDTLQSGYTVTTTPGLEYNNGKIDVVAEEAGTETITADVMADEYQLKDSVSVKVPEPIYVLQGSDIMPDTVANINNDIKYICNEDPRQKENGPASRTYWLERNGEFVEAESWSAFYSVNEEVGDTITFTAVYKGKTFSKTVQIVSVDITAPTEGILVAGTTYTCEAVVDAPHEDYVWKVNENILSGNSLTPVTSGTIILDVTTRVAMTNIVASDKYEISDSMAYYVVMKANESKWKAIIKQVASDNSGIIYVPNSISAPAEKTPIVAEVQNPGGNGNATIIGDVRWSIYVPVLGKEFRNEPAEGFNFTTGLNGDIVINGWTFPEELHADKLAAVLKIECTISQSGNATLSSERPVTLVLRRREVTPTPTPEPTPTPLPTPEPGEGELVFRTPKTSIIVEPTGNGFANAEFSVYFSSDPGEGDRPGNYMWKLVWTDDKSEIPELQISQSGKGNYIQIACTDRDAFRRSIDLNLTKNASRRALLQATWFSEDGAFYVESEIHEFEFKLANY